MYNHSILQQSSEVGNSHEHVLSNCVQSQEFGGSQSFTAQKKFRTISADQNMFTLHCYILANWHCLVTQPGRKGEFLVFSILSHRLTKPALVVCGADHDSARCSGPRGSNLTAPLAFLQQILSRRCSWAPLAVLQQILMRRCSWALNLRPEDMIVVGMD